MRALICSFALLSLFLGCSAPKPPTKPLWYTNPPTSYESYYAATNDHDALRAKRLAMVEFRRALLKDFEERLHSRTSSYLSAFEREALLNEAKEIVNKISFRGVREEQSALHENRHYQLTSIPKRLLFEEFTQMDAAILQETLARYDSLQTPEPLIRYGLLKELYKEVYLLAATELLKELVVSTYDATPTLLKIARIHKEYLELQKSISIFVATDVDSRPLAEGLKLALTQEGLSLASHPKAPGAYRLFVSSNASGYDEYEFHIYGYQAAYTLLNANNKQLASRKHALIGKSRIDYADAKKQSLIGHYKTIKQIGLFQFLGL